METIKIETARAEIMATLNMIQSKYNFTPNMLDLILSQIQNDVRNQVKIQLLNEFNLSKEEKDGKDKVHKQ